MKPKELEKIKIRPTLINDYLITQIEVDLLHINHGLDKSKNYKKKARSHFTIRDVASLFESLTGTELVPSTHDGYEYFVVENNFFNDDRLYRMIFCIEQKNNATSGIITFYRI